MSWAKEKELLGKEIIELLYDNHMIKTWYNSKPEGWKLISGIWSPLYINLRLIGSYPMVLKKVGYALGRLIEEECDDINRIVGIASAGVPIAASISLQKNIPLCYTRKLQGVKSLSEFKEHIKKYGQHSLVEGIIENGDNIALIDDLVTKLDSKLIAIEQLLSEAKIRNIRVIGKSIVVLVDREQGAEVLANEYDLKLFSLIPFKSLGIEWLKNKLSKVEYDVLKDYLNNIDKYQNKQIQDTLRNLKK